METDNPLKEHYNFTELVKAAKEAGIRVVAFDTQISYSMHNSDCSQAAAADDRYKPMNYLAYQKIQQEKSDGKWIAFVGRIHAATCDGVPGISNILGVPSVIVQDLAKGVTTEIESVSTNVHNFSQHKGMNIDVVIKLDPDKYLTQQKEQEIGFPSSIQRSSTPGSTIDKRPVEPSMENAFEPPSVPQLPSLDEENVLAITHEHLNPGKPDSTKFEEITVEVNTHLMGNKFALPFLGLKKLELSQKELLQHLQELYDKGIFEPNACIKFVYKSSSSRERDVSVEAPAYSKRYDKNANRFKVSEILEHPKRISVIVKELRQVKHNMERGM